MSFHYPVTIARDVVHVLRLLPPKAFEAHGVGILEKVFDIGCSLADVLLLHPRTMHVPGLEIGPRDYLIEIVRTLGTVSNGNSKYFRLLAAKADECLQLRLRGNLPEVERSNLIEEIDGETDEEQEVDYGRNNAEKYSQNFMNRILGFEPAGATSQTDLVARRDSYDYSSLSEPPAMDSGNDSNLPFSIPTLEWNRIVHPDAPFRGSFD